MKRTALLAVAAYAFATIATALAGGEGWITDMEAAKTQAAKEKKDLLLDFTGSDWCGWCIKLNEEVFSKDAFKTGIKDKFVPVEIDFPRKKELEPKLKEQNKALQEKMKIGGYPTIILCDATGRPYAKTGYQEGGAEKYVKSLDELQAVRVKRDQAFADADKATDDVAKAKCLLAGLKTMDQEIVESNYADVVEKIGKLDKSDPTGFVKTTQESIAKKTAAAKQQAVLQEFFTKKVVPLMEAKEFEKLSAEVKSFLKENPDTPEEIKVSLLAHSALAAPMEKKDLPAAIAVVEEVAKAYPNSEFAKHIDSVKGSIKAKLEAKPEEAAPDKKADP